MTPLPAPPLRPDRSFERLYRRHVGDVYRYSLAMLRNPSDAEDVTQTTFLNAYRVYRRGERPRAARNWLIAIAHNVCRQRFRELRRRAGEVSLEESPAVSLGRDDDLPRAEGLRRALGHLGFNQRAALVMRELEGRSYSEIGQMLGVSTSAVETLIFRARRALREQLEESLTCTQAELAISRQLDHRLPGSEKPSLRAHLRECADCSALARKQRARRAALRGLTAIPLPPSLASLFGGGAGTGGGLAVKAAAVLAAGAAVGGGAYEAVERSNWRGSHAVAGATVSEVSPSFGAASRPEAAQIRLAASPSAAGPVSANPARMAATRGRRPARTTVEHVVATTPVQTALPASGVESVTPPARAKPRLRLKHAGRPHGPKAENPRSRATGRGRPPKSRLNRPARAEPRGKATPRTQKTNAAKKAAARKLVPVSEAVRGEADAPGKLTAAAHQAARAPSVPPGQAKKDDAPQPEAPPGQPAGADEDAGTDVSHEPPGQLKQKP